MLERNRHSVYDLEYRLVVVTKFRCPVLNAEVSKRLEALCISLLEGNWRCKIIQIATMSDYIQIIFSAPPQVQLSKLVNNFKTVTSRRLRKEFASHFAAFYNEPYLWSNSYLVATVSDRTQDIAVEYIKTQDVPEP